MAKLTRKLLKVFGGSGDANDFGQFGSQAAGSPVKTKEISSIQSLAAWMTGLRASLLSGTKQPFVEDLNSVLYVFASQLSYCFQEGVPEYDAAETYYIGSLVKKTGTSEIYASLTDTNTGNALPSLTDNTNWSCVLPVRFSQILGLVLDAQINSLSAAKVTGTLVDAQIATGITATKIAGILANATLPATNLTGQIGASQILNNTIVPQFLTTITPGVPDPIETLGDTVIKSRSITTNGGLVIAVGRMRGIPNHTVPYVTLDRDGDTGYAVSHRWKLGGYGDVFETSLTLLDNPTAGTHTYNLRGFGFPTGLRGRITLIELKK